MKDDLISRQAAIDAICKVWCNCSFAESECKKIAENGCYECAICDDVNVIMKLPPAQPDLSEYSDKLWRNAYERGKRDAQAEQPDLIRCRDCKYVRTWRSESSAKKYGQIYECVKGVLFCPEADDFCSRAERQEDE